MNYIYITLISIIIFSSNILSQPLTDSSATESDYFNLYEAEADVLMDKKEFKEAIEIYDKAINYNDTSTYSHYLRGICKYNTKDFNGAIEDFTYAIKNSPKNLELKWDHGNRTIKIGNEYKLKKNHLSTMHFYYIAYAYRAFSEYNLMKYQEAINDFDIYIKYNKENVAVYYYRGNIELYLKNFEKAISDFTKAVEIDSTYIDAYYSRGNTNCLINKFDIAYLDFDKMVKTNENDAKALYFRGLCNIELENKIKGCQDLRKAEKLEYTKATEYIKKFCTE